MRKLIILSLVIPAGLLLSFTLQPRAVKKLGTNLYEIIDQKYISSADKQELIKLVGNHYGVTDFSKQVIITRESALNIKSGGMIDHTISKDFFQAKVIIWRAGLLHRTQDAKLDPEGERINAVVSKYARGM